jgi:plastocyanin
VISVGSENDVIEQPVHIHHGTCDDLGEVEFPLTNVVDGRSLTYWNAPISEVMRGGFVVNLHKSDDEIGVYTACAELADSAPVEMTDITAAPDDEEASDKVDSKVTSDIEGFKLQNLTVSVGTVISWTNQDNAPHTVTHGVSPDVDFNPAFQSGTFTKGQEFFNTFNTVGTFPYFCELHPSMTAVVTVESGSAPPVISDTGGDPGY